MIPMCYQETKLLGNIDSSASVNGSGPKFVSNGAHVAVTSPTTNENALPICKFFLSALSTHFIPLFSLSTNSCFWLTFIQQISNSICQSFICKMFDTYLDNFIVNT